MKISVPKKKWLRLSIVILAASFTGCVTPLETGAPGSSNQEGYVQNNEKTGVKRGSMYRLEPLHAFTSRPGEIEFAVTSTGCTKLDDFSIETEIDGGQCTLAIYRVRADRCRRAPTTVSFKMNWDLQGKCAETPAIVRNSVGSGGPAIGKAVYK